VEILKRLPGRLYAIWVLTSAVYCIAKAYPCDPEG
jgi:hypothetical protein